MHIWIGYWLIFPLLTELVCRTHTVQHVFSCFVNRVDQSLSVVLGLRCSGITCSEKILLTGFDMPTTYEKTMFLWGFLLLRFFFMALSFDIGPDGSQKLWVLSWCACALFLSLQLWKEHFQPVDQKMGNQFWGPVGGRSQIAGVCLLVWIFIKLQAWGFQLSQSAPNRPWTVSYYIYCPP